MRHYANQDKVIEIYCIAGDSFKELHSKSRKSNGTKLVVPFTNRKKHRAEIYLYQRLWKARIRILK